MYAEMAKLKAPEKEQAQSQKGSMIVEFALILPVFVMLVCGMIHYSMALNDKIILTMAAWQGARAGAISSSTISAQNAAEAACYHTLISWSGYLSATITPTMDSSTKMCRVETRCYYPPFFMFPGIDLSATTSMSLESP